MKAPSEARGPIAWMARNHVSANILMLVLLVGGGYMALQIKQEVFPEFELDRVDVRVAYPGASPEEVEQGIILAVEEAVRALDGVDEVNGTAAEGLATISVDVADGADPEAVHRDVEQAVSRIVTFPLEAEEPRVTVAMFRHGVVQLQVYGETTEWSLRQLAEQVRDRLLSSPEITQVDLVGARGMETRVEIPQHALDAHDLTLTAVAERLREAIVEVPGGELDTSAGALLVRVRDRRQWAEEIAELPLVVNASGSVVRVRDVAQVTDGFEDVERSATYDGQPAIGVEVFRVGEQGPMAVSDAVHAALPDVEASLPDGVHVAVNSDRSSYYRQRLSLLLKNAFIGLVLVLLLLGLFLEPRLAFWVTLGIPTSFVGALLFLPFLDVTINIVSMFAFIVALGIVVDDAIVAGENIYEHRRRGAGLVEAAIAGARQVAMPITFAVLTNIIAFIPLMMVPGRSGKIWYSIPLVVATVFVISWVEALFILPAHLGRARPPRDGAGPITWLRKRVQGGLEWVMRGPYVRLLDASTRHRYLTTAVALAVLMITLSYAFSGRMGFTFMPRTESDRAVASITLPVGTALERVEATRDHVVAAADRVVAEHGGERLSEGVFTRIDGNLVEVTIYLTPPDQRPVGTRELVGSWRDATGEMVGIQSAKFESDRGGPGGGRSLTVELSHRDSEMLERSGRELAMRLTEFAGVRDVDDGSAQGKEQLDIQLRQAGRSLGLTAADVGRQVRSAFHGAEALRQQRGRNEVRLRVILPERERTSALDVLRLRVRTPAGRTVLLSEIARVTRGRAYTSIRRRNGRRTVTVGADVHPSERVTEILATLNAETLPELAADIPGLAYSFEGRQARRRESNSALFSGLGIALLLIYVLLTIPFRSYLQPMAIMMAIPFGIVGAIAGHLIMGYVLSTISIMGMVALSGVVVNDALVMMDFANRRRREGVSAIDAIRSAGVRRFRPILLTTLTTFGGLAPMMFETSRQARFLIPMALSLGFGIVFATTITLVLLPSLYLIIEDARGLATAARGRLGRPVPDTA